ncbi:MAG: hypothetical protein MJ112_06335 [Lachnospiraceae bacterium]|nr:hypothetical protein [Lachnospiraceae bacterium]
MPEQVTGYKCEACGGPLAFDAATGKLKCDYCQSLYSVEEVKARYAKENQQIVDEAEGGAAVKDEYFNVADGMKAYQCKSCGAELITDPTTTATSCPYCGNTAIIPQQMHDLMKPKFVLPFKVEKQAVVNKLSSYYKGKKLLPSSFGSTNHINEVKGVYVPFWLYSGTVEADCTFNCEEVKETKNETEKIITTKHYVVKRKGTCDFTNIPTDASNSMPDDLMDSIEPYDFKDLKNFEMEYLLGFIADKYDVEAKDCLGRARNRAEESAIQAAADTVGNYDNVSEVRAARHVAYRKEKQEYAMLPVWLLSSQWNGQNFLFAVNGQTGEMTGNLPVDKTKQLIFNLLWFLPEFILISALMMGSGKTNWTGFLIAAIISLIIMLISNSMRVGSMRPVTRKRQADNYLKAGADGSKIHLTIKEDTYTNTTVKKEPIRKN